MSYFIGEFAEQQASEAFVDKYLARRGLVLSSFSRASVGTAGSFQIETDKLDGILSRYFFSPQNENVLFATRARLIATYFLSMNCHHVHAKRQRESCGRRDTKPWLVMERGADLSRLRTMRGKSVVVKPNFVGMDPYPFTTNCGLLRTVIDTLRAYDVSYRILAGPSMFCDTRAVLSHYGRKIGERIDECEDAVLVEQCIHGERYFIPGDVLECDVIVNVCQFKQHNDFAFSGAIKNMFGFLPHFQRLRAHKERDYGSLLIAGLADLPVESLVIMDCREFACGGQQPRFGGAPVQGFGFVTGNAPCLVDAAAMRVFCEYTGKCLEPSATYLRNRTKNCGKGERCAEMK